jgi:hypothetical protein
MGQLAQFDIGDLVARFGLNLFVETGTGAGDSLACAAQLPPLFSMLYSCEIHPDMAYLSAKRFAHDERVLVSNQASALFLSALLRVLPPTPTLFWLDAHFPGADYGLSTYGSEPSLNLRLPLEDELQIIHEFRRGAARDVILIDDARIWLDMNFGSGPLPDALRPLCPANRDIDFIVDLFAPTHIITVHSDDEGYIAVLPL